MSHDDFSKPVEPHSAALPPVDPWAEADPLVAGTAEVAAAPGGQLGPVSSGVEPGPPGPGPAAPAPARRSRVARLSTLGLAGGLLIGLLVAGLPMLTSLGANEAEERPGLAADLTAPVPPTATAGAGPSVSAEPTPTPTKAKTSPTPKISATPKAAAPRPTKATGSPSPKATTPSARVGALVNGGSGTCLTGGGAGVQLILSSCNKSVYQRWSLRSDGTIRAGQLCMSLPFGATDNLTKIIMAGCDGSPAQRFYLNSLDDLVSRHADKCLDAYERQTADGTPVVLFPCFGPPNQSWYLK